jgi:hypothetical protein
METTPLAAEILLLPKEPAEDNLSFLLESRSPRLRKGTGSLLLLGSHDFAVAWHFDRVKNGHTLSLFNFF